MFLPPEDAPNAQAQCPATGLLAALRAQAASNPAVAFACAARIDGEARRDAILEEAFLALARQSPALAMPYRDAVASRPWIADLSLPLALALDDPRILRTVVQAHPSVAIRETEAMHRAGLLPSLIHLIPGEALGIAAGSSARAARLRELLPPALQRLLARDDLDLPLKQRLAWLGGLPHEQALTIARNDRDYFAHIAAIEPESVPFAERWFLEAKQQGPAARIASLRNWQPRHLYLLLVAGRQQVDKALFQTFFDSLLRLRIAGWREWPHRRRFVRDAAVYGRLSELPPEMVLQALEPPKSYEDMLLAAEVAEILALTLDPSLAKPTPRDAWMLQRHFFYDDDDGRESFASFRRAYRDGGWAWTEHETGVTVRKGPLRIEANLPGRDHPMRETPGVIVHRGHEFHVPKTLAALPPSAAFVYLGSCRGMGSVADVLQLAAQADVLVTRATGSHTVNDPLLKALNEAALDGPIVWESFWAAQQQRFRGNPLFAEYVPPHRNAAAYLIKAHRRYLSQESAPHTDNVFHRWREELAARCGAAPRQCLARP
ncbi:MAG: hypothetical protein JNK48_27475 [Bryobacterales bacterium]|nr:hypothetical protein [Bryobacterales bacterium]